MREALLRYNRILCADDHYKSWQEVTCHSFCIFMYTGIDQVEVRN